MNTMSMLDITVTVAGVNRVINLVIEHGSLKFQQLRAHDMNYIYTSHRVAQNAYHMYEALLVSITKELRQRIIIDIDKAKINDVLNGPLFYKLIMFTCCIDTPGTVMRLREKLLNLDAYISTVQEDVEKFNKYLKSLVIQLAARGQTIA